MSEVTIEDPIRHRTGVRVQEDGRVSVGREHAGKTVNLVVEEAAETCVKCSNEATHMEILKDGEPNPPDIVVCSEHASEEAERL